MLGSDLLGPDGEMGATEVVAVRAVVAVMGKEAVLAEEEEGAGIDELGLFLGLSRWRRRVWVFLDFLGLTGWRRSVGREGVEEGACMPVAAVGSLGGLGVLGRPVWPRCWGVWAVAGLDWVGGGGGLGAGVIWVVAGGGWWRRAWSGLIWAADGGGGRRKGGLVWVGFGMEMCLGWAWYGLG